jgi:hypothetical protein
VSNSSSSGTSFVLILLTLGGGIWLLQNSLLPPLKPARTPPAEQSEPESSTASRALDFSKTNGEALNQSMSDQLKSVQEMVGGTNDGKTYVLPTGKK